MSDVTDFAALGLVPGRKVTFTVEGERVVEDPPPYDVGETVKISGSAVSDGIYHVRDLEPGVVGVRVNSDGTVTLPRPPIAVTPLAGTHTSLRVTGTEARTFPSHAPTKTIRVETTGLDGVVRVGTLEPFDDSDPGHTNEACRQKFSEMQWKLAGPDDPRPEPPSFDAAVRGLAKGVASTLVATLKAKVRCKPAEAVDTPLGTFTDDELKEFLARPLLAAHHVARRVPQLGVPGCRCGCMDGKPRR